MNTAAVAVADSAVDTNTVAAEADLVVVVGMHIAAEADLVVVVGMNIAAVAAPDCYDDHQMMPMFAGSAHPAIAEQEEVGALMEVVAIYSWLACDVLALAPWYPKLSCQPDTFAFHDQSSLPSPSRTN